MCRRFNERMDCGVCPNRFVDRRCPTLEGTNLEVTECVDFVELPSIRFGRCQWGHERAVIQPRSQTSNFRGNRTTINAEGRLVIENINPEVPSVANRAGVFPSSMSSPPPPAYTTPQSISIIIDRPPTPDTPTPATRNLTRSTNTGTNTINRNRLAVPSTPAALTRTSRMTTIRRPNPPASPILDGPLMIDGKWATPFYPTKTQAELDAAAKASDAISDPIATMFRVGGADSAEYQKEIREIKKEVTRVQMQRGAEKAALERAVREEPGFEVFGGVGPPGNREIFAAYDHDGVYQG